MSPKGATRTLRAIHEKEEDSKPDGGWGWVVVFAAMSICSIVDGYTYSTHFFYEKFLQEYKKDESITSIFVSVMNATIMFVSPFGSGLIKVYGTTIVTLIGTFLAMIGLILSVYLDQSVYYHIISLGLIAGTGYGLVFISQVIVVTYWFERRIAIATGIAECGSGFGMAAFPLFINKFIQDYGWRGAHIMLAGITSLCMAFSSLHSKPTVVLWTSWKQMFSMSKFFTALKETINFRLLWTNWSFVVFVFSNVLLNFVFFEPILVTTSRIIKIGIGDADDSSRLMMWFGISNGIGRILFGWIATCGPCHQLWLYVICTCAMGVSVLLTNLANTITWMSCAYFSIGLFYGGNVCLMSVVLIEMLGHDKVANAYGIVAFFNGFANLIGPPILSQFTIRNVTNSTVPSKNNVTTTMLPRGMFSNGQERSVDTYATVILISGILTIISAALLLRVAWQFRRFDHELNKQVSKCANVTGVKTGSGSENSSASSVQLTIAKHLGKTVHNILVKTCKD